MTTKKYFQYLLEQTEELRHVGLYKEERIILSPQKADILIQGGHKAINFCANNYLGLSDHPQVIQAAKKGLDSHGFGLSSVRFICGTQDIHKELEHHLSHFLGKEETILYSSCFDANGGLFETLFGAEDAIISDALNHASIIDGIRLCKAKRFRYANNDMADLEAKLEEARGARFRLIVTDGVFSMDGIIANLPDICDLADRYDALVMVDDSHAVGVLGKKGRGTHEYWDVIDRVDILTGTLGKALGGASGGYVSAKREIVDWLRQRSRPYLFSNTLAPSITAASIEVLKILETHSGLREKLQRNAKFFREEMHKLGFDLVPGSHPIIPVMLGDAKVAQEMASRLLKEGIYVISFSYPVVPKDMARIRVQISAGHESHHLEHAVAAFAKVGKTMGVIP